MTIPARPVLVNPVLDAKPWGGRRLESCGINLTDHLAVGEALLTAPEATVSSGPLIGVSLADLARQAPGDWIGARGLAATGGREVFPLLVKLIDANADLSIQVHPDDAAAAAANLGTGKTEAWHVLDARPGSVLYTGLLAETDVSVFMQACLQGDGSASAFLRRIAAEPGMTLIVPAGTPHAIGEGCLIYEIQQPSNVTFRLDDWGRVDDSGRPRAVHHDDGFAALAPLTRPSPIRRVVLSARPRRELLAATRYFALELIALELDEQAELPGAGSPQVLTCLTGEASLTAGDWQGALHTGETTVIPVACASTLASARSCVILRGWVPDLEQDVRLPAAAMGAASEEIAQLGLCT